MAKQAKTPKSFENAIAQLEEIVAAMESRDLPLEDALDHYQQGIGLLRYCQDTLSRAEARLETLEANANDDDGAIAPADDPS
ncbi:MAG TPA: exodeoxyribonuclease VII small subunit [Denitromonas sp.]|uniref:exodeoxyribonuclease VII small subunit n=1 Tax=Denitromonas sp. TaxID=2734609 RepID=UPI001E000FAA|nr:exodeoxyribonuclease VII small subunit [Rhodocyclaceae bacterium]MCP5221245.1 exodeoxyribonuclease VII small subunit [Zoogloeaceae bacterium]HPR07469.1 exodeoxyribonuclease VII small subunit [Denitromonas sp.]HQU89433.1 exodeoxyribonuclease VII small subunit [Denitromonas sp.]HQV15859.1 exodeoxyribonuclease VII small subunit [Denitromonas sp.]